MKAEQACAEYERWAAECTRLTNAIAVEECPEQEEGDESNGWCGHPSCFSRAATEQIQEATEEEPSMRRNLSQIEREVAHCESCANLVALIRERKHARQRFGVAKRQVRVVGKRMFATEGG